MRWRISSEGTFQESIRNSPRDEVHCLVFADWLDDAGDDRAAFIRDNPEGAQ